MVDRGVDVRQNAYPMIIGQKRREKLWME